MKPIRIRSFAVLASCLVAASGQANVLVNGGFEAPAQVSGTFVTFGPGGEPPGFGWQVSAGTIDLGALPIVPFVQFAAYEGRQVIDLHGNGSGAIFQDFTTVVGQRYALTFAYADNPFAGGVSSADILVTDIVGNTNLLGASVAHSTSANSAAGADWTLFGGSFVATGTSTRLRITSTSASGGASDGLLLDAVSVDLDNTSTVPAPVGVVLAGAALGLLRLRRRD